MLADWSLVLQASLSLPGIALVFQFDSSVYQGHLLEESMRSARKLEIDSGELNDVREADVTE
jgi:hypothetical protein